MINLLKSSYTLSCPYSSMFIKTKEINGGGLVASEMKSLSGVWLFATPWPVAYQVPPSMGFSRQEYWSGLPLLLQGIILTQGSNPGLLQA